MNKTLKTNKLQEGSKWEKEPLYSLFILFVIQNKPKVFLFNLSILLNSLFKSNSLRREWEPSILQVKFPIATRILLQ